MIAFQAEARAQLGRSLPHSNQPEVIAPLAGREDLRIDTLPVVDDPQP